MLITDIKRKMKANATRHQSLRLSSDKLSPTTILDFYTFPMGELLLAVSSLLAYANMVTYRKQKQPLL